LRWQQFVARRYRHEGVAQLPLRRVGHLVYSALRHVEGQRGWTNSFQRPPKSAFDGDISGWSTFSLQYADKMFKDATAFNANIAGWDTSQIESMEAMFQGATSFDQNIGAFATSKVTNMTSMFQGATAFNRDLSGWCVSNINAKPSGFDDGAIAWSNMRPVWDSCP